MPPSHTPLGEVVYPTWGALVSTPMSHPLFIHGGGLNLNGHLVLNALDPVEGMTTKQISSATGVPCHGVRRALNALADLVAAFKASDGLWYRVPAFDIDAAASDLGLAARAEARSRRFEDQRARHRDAVDDAHKAHQKRRREGAA